MDFSIDGETLALLERFRRIMHEDVVSLDIVFAKKSFKEMVPTLAKVRQKVKAEGLWAPQVPKEWGGMEMPFRQHALVSEVLGFTPLGHYIFGCQAPDAGNIEILLQFGTDEQKKKWLGPLTRGDIRSCFSMTEPDRAGSNPTWLETRAVKDGSDYVINGRKWFTTAADGAAFAI